MRIVHAQVPHVVQRIADVVHAAAALAAASSTPARSSASEYSAAPGSVPSVSTAPVAIILMKSAPPASSSRTRCRTSSTPLATPARNSTGTVPDGALVISPPPPRTVT